MQAGETIQGLMQDMDVMVDTAQNVADAMQLIYEKNCREEGYQIVLLDGNLPNLDVVEVSEKFREILPETMILVLTAYEEDSEYGGEDTMQMENVGILQKPFFVSALKDKVMAIRHSETLGQNEQEAAGRSLEGMYFLAAEDNEINAEILREILTIEDAKCEIVENGQLAVERFLNSEEGEFDAILMDVQMPVMNGYEATRAIRALERRDARDIPIIAMTANAFAEDEKEALCSGMNVHLSKPIDVALLKKIIQQYVPVSAPKASIEQSQ